ncbi:MAG: TatD family hydrolase [Chlamydiae bacterium]|nr:TatD family hydrolase [Chlamydiota bacterium]MBI3276789.1 TatD family hydrolase [Chlamydiota bacterium]
MIDTHVHLNDPAFDEDRALVIERARGSKVEVMLDVSEDLASAKKSIDLFSKHSDIWSAVGLHPHRACILGESEIHSFQKILHHERVVAVGEIGLDYYYDHQPREIQKKAFAQMLALAREGDFPVLIHHREAEQDLINLLNSFKGIKGLIHCFTASLDLAKVVLDLGFYISFSGIVTFKKAEPLREVIRHVPMDRILIETDAPFLAPEPMRGKRNEPSFIQYTAQEIARIKNIKIDEFERAVSKNVGKLFEKIKS